MLQGFNLSLTVDPRVGPLFNNIDISVGDCEKVALVGRNGVGKTRLLRILAGLDEPSSGRVVLSTGSAIAYLPQDFDHGFEGTLTELFDVPYHSFAKAASQIGLDPDLLHEPYGQLSLGERMRGTIAGLLASEPTVLLLDEPTNHLDSAAKAWLTGFLKDCRESVLLVCHDRAILNQVPEKVAELTPRGLEVYSGNYAAMLEQKQTSEARQQREWEEHRAETRRLRNVAETIKQRAVKTGRKPPGNNYSAAAKPFYEAKKARVEKQSKAVLARVEREIKVAPEKPHAGDALKIEFPTRPLRSAIPLHVRGLTFGFGERALFEDLDITLESRARLAIVGPNGSGKTTLLRILTGDLEPDEGQVEWAGDVLMATLSQARTSVAMDEPAGQAVGGDLQQARTLLACLGMRGEIGGRIVSKLSVGERTKVEIASMIMRGANVLILDEPTNHLDIPSLIALEDALSAFPGVVIFVSHDPEFVDRLATDILSLDEAIDPA